VSEAAETIDATPGPEPTRRERRKAETRRRLLDAARELFAERGFEATRPQDIARAADVAAGTFYTHFDDRRDVFRAVTAETAAELMCGNRYVIATFAGAETLDVPEWTDDHPLNREGGAEWFEKMASGRVDL